MSLSATHARGLWVCTGLFALRVVAQPAALWVNVPLLPPFDAWHGNVLPYPLLLLSQFAILAIMVRTARRVGLEQWVPRRPVGRLLVALGGIYAGTMMARLLLGLTVLREYAWFAKPLPTFFHLVLASFVLILGRLHLLHAGAGVRNRNSRYGSTAE